MTCISSKGQRTVTSPLYGMAEVNVGQFASALGINDKMFVSNKVWATGEYLADDRQAEDSLRLSRERLWRDKIDLMLCHSLVNVDVMVPLLQAWKKEGRIRYLGVTHYELPYFEALAERYCEMPRRNDAADAPCVIGALPAHPPFPDPSRQCLTPVERTGDDRLTGA